MSYEYYELPVEKLKEALNQLDENCTLVPNAVGNLSVLRYKDYIGYIDFRDGSLHIS